jgi:aminopeptidase-like protein
VRTFAIAPEDADVPGHTTGVPHDDLPTGQGDEMHRFCAELFPLCRSITGDGVRETLAHVRKLLPIEIHEVPSGTAAFDWTVPDEWTIRDACVSGPDGRRVIDFRASNLHVVSYSTPVNRRLTLAELRPHLFTLEDQPDLVPYRTSYYNPSWGFCLAHSALLALEDGDYDVVIDSSLEPGSLTYGELLIPGSSDEEVLLSTHVCHPSLANDNLSGIAVLTFLGARLRERPLRYSYRLLFAPGTIGSIVWLSRNEAVVERVRHGLVLAGIGDAAPFTYKRSRHGDTDIDRAVEHVLATRSTGARVVDFSPYGYDERQYCSPGFDLPVGRLGRSVHGEHPEYHTSADNLDFVGPGQLADALARVVDVLGVLEGNERMRNLNPKCEPQLGRRGLYRAVGGNVDSQSIELAMLWVLNLSDGAHDLLDIARRAGLPFPAIRRAADALAAHDLLEPVAVEGWTACA